MRIDLSCPGEILRAELPTAEEPWIRILILNGTDRGINSCEATAKVLDREGRELGRTVHRARALAGRPYGTFLMTIPMEPIEDAAGIEARLDKAWFEDNDVWRRNEAAEIEYEDNMLPPGNDLNALKYVAGPTAVGFPSQQARLWVCVCGRANGNGSDHCARCRREKETLFRQYNREAVLRQVSQRERQLDLKSRGAREEAAQIQRQREEEFDRQQARKKRRYRLWGALGATLLIAAAAYWGGAPLTRRISADQAAKEGRLEDAETLLAGITGFPGVEERITAVKLEEARRDGTAAVSETGELPETTVLAITTGGYGKRTDPDEYREQGRGGMGIKAMQLTEKTGDLAALMFVHEDEDILLITDDGTIIRARAADVRLCGRSTQGVRIMRLAEGSTVVGVCRAEKEEETPDEPLNAEETKTDGEEPKATEEQ